MIDPHWLYLLPIIFLAYFCKANTGFGAAIVIIALGAVIIGPLPALALSAVLEVIGGVALLRLDSTPDTRRFWAPLSFAMFLGTVAGGLLLRFFAVHYLRYIVCGALVAVGVWLIVFRSRRTSTLSERALPEAYRKKDLVVCLIAGTSAGLTGISAPPLLYHFGGKFAKEAVRRILTRVFLVESATRVVTYSVINVMQLKVLVLALVAIPVMFVGLYVGNHTFFKIPETAFSRIAGIVVIVMAIRLMA